jgi:DNA-binding GntR family transcriptional regulator
MKIDPNSSKPLHLQAEEILRRLIEENDYKNGKLLPSETDMSKQLNISRNTLRQAINKLVIEGLLIRKKGVGTKVAKKGIVRRFVFGNDKLSSPKNNRLLIRKLVMHSRFARMYINRQASISYLIHIRNYSTIKAPLSYIN